MNRGDWENESANEKRIAPLNAWRFGGAPAGIAEAKPKDAEE